MKFELESHKGVILENPTIEIASITDFPIEKKFKPSILFIIEPNIRIHHDLPTYDYIDGTWTDEDVEIIVDEYLNTISLK